MPLLGFLLPRIARRTCRPATRWLSLPNAQPQQGALITFTWSIPLQ